MLITSSEKGPYRNPPSPSAVRAIPPTVIGAYRKGVVRGYVCDLWSAAKPS